MRDVPDLVPGDEAAIKDKSIPTFELQRGSSNADPETEWLINGQQFEADKPLISVKENSGGVWRIRNGGGGWVHPLHLHMEEHRVVAAQRQALADDAPPGRHRQGRRDRAGPERGGRHLPPVPHLQRARTWRTATTWPTRTTT